MGKHAKKSKHSDMESEQSDSSSSSSEVEQKHKSKKHANAVKGKGKHSHINSKKTRDSSSTSSSTDSESDESVKKRKSHKSQTQEVKKTKSSSSKWDSPVEKRRHSSPVRRDERDARSKRDQRDYGRDKRDERRNDFVDRHRNERGRSRENRNFRERSRERVRETRNRSNDRWPQGRRGRQANSHSPSPRRRNARRQQSSRSRDRGDGNHSWGKKTEGNDRRQDKKPQQKEEPNFGLSGALTEDTNKVNGVVVKYSEPLEARRPKRRWRLYPFKGETALPVLHIHRQSCFLVGRERKVVDLAVDHPSCSKQHAALQYRLVPFTREDGSQGKRVRLYLIDLDSANGTFLNNKKIEARKYYELFEKDVIKFGFSTREYVLLHENSQEDQEDDDVTIKKEEPDD